MFRPVEIQINKQDLHIRDVGIAPWGCGSVGSLCTAVRAARTSATAADYEPHANRGNERRARRALIVCTKWERGLGVHAHARTQVPGQGHSGSYGPLVGRVAFTPEEPDTRLAAGFRVGTVAPPTPSWPSSAPSAEAATSGLVAMRGMARGAARAAVLDWPRAEPVFPRDRGARRGPAAAAP